MRNTTATGYELRKMAAEESLRSLRNVRDALIRAECRGPLLRKVRAVIKSCEGAIRNADAQFTRASGARGSR